MVKGLKIAVNEILRFTQYDSHPLGIIHIIALFYLIMLKKAVFLYLLIIFAVTANTASTRCEKHPGKLDVSRSFVAVFALTAKIWGKDGPAGRFCCLCQCCKGNENY